jgi:hypothetical protein
VSIALRRPGPPLPVPDGSLVAAAVMLLACPAALPTWLWAVWARKRCAVWVLPAAAIAYTLLAWICREWLGGVYHGLLAGVASGIATHGLRPSWGLLGAAAALFGRSLILTAPVGIPVGLIAGEVSCRARPRTTPIPLRVTPTRPLPERIERSPYLAVAIRSDPPGDLPMDWRRGAKYLVVPHREAGLSSIVAGRPGSGKSVLITRQVYLKGRAGQRGIVADCKGEPDFAAEVRGAYLEGWRDGGHPGWPGIHEWPSQPLSAWVGGPQAVANRLLACWAWNPRNEWHREPVAMALRLALNAPGPEVASSADLIARLRPGVLEDLWRGQAEGEELLRSLSKDHRMDDVRLRLGNLMASLGQLLDGDPRWPLGTANLTIISLPVMAAEHDAAQILRVLMADMAHFVVARKVPGERAFIIVDEASAIPGGRDHMVHVTERGRSAGVATMLCVQSDAGLGDDSDANRLIGAVNTVILFNTAEPERLVRLAGSRRQVEQTSTSIGDDGITRYTSAKVWVDQVDPNVARALPVGHAFILSGGRGQLARIIRPPATTAPGEAGAVVRLDASRRPRAVEP